MFPAIIGALGMGISALSGAKSRSSPVAGLGAAAKRALGGSRRRRRRSRLTPGELAELAHIKSILGRTAAANALPFYLGRGR